MAETRWHRQAPWGLLALSVLPSLFLVGPLAALAWRALPSGRWMEAFGNPIVGQALGLSLTTTMGSLALVVTLGTPMAYLLARYSFPGRRLLDTLIDLPMVLPPAVAGLSLLLLFGRNGLLGPFLKEAGLEVAFSTTAVLLAQAFVAGPFYIRSARAGFESVDPQLERVAATLGESDAQIFWRVTVPLAFPSLLSGAVMTWARALGEFGATIMFAGNLPGRTQTMPLAVYTAMESDLWAALTLALLLVVLSLVAMVLLRIAARTMRRPVHAP
ncbi:MAG: ABC transporter permease [Chloroflexota bacterium]